MTQSPAVDPLPAAPSDLARLADLATQHAVVGGSPGTLLNGGDLGGLHQAEGGGLASLRQGHYFKSNVLGNASESGEVLQEPVVRQAGMAKLTRGTLGYKPMSWISSRRTA